jgi:hypothetical protein
MEASCISYKETGFFSPTVIDYIENRADLQPFYGYRPDMDGFAEFLKNKKVVADRDILYRVLSKQYSHNQQEVGDSKLKTQ